MSLDQNSRPSRWPSIIIRAVLVISVFIGLNWWVKNNKTATHSPGAAEQNLYPPVPSGELRDGTAIIFILDLATGGEEPASDLQQRRTAAAASLYHQMQLLVRHAGEQSSMPLRTGIIVTGYKTDAADPAPQQARTLMHVRPPEADEALRETLLQLEPGKSSDQQAARTLAISMLNESAMRNRHVILFCSTCKQLPDSQLEYSELKEGNQIILHKWTLHLVDQRSPAESIDENATRLLESLLKPASLPASAPVPASGE